MLHITYIYRSIFALHRRNVFQMLFIILNAYVIIAFFFLNMYTSCQQLIRSGNHRSFLYLHRVPIQSKMCIITILLNSNTFPVVEYLTRHVTIHCACQLREKNCPISHWPTKVMSTWVCQLEYSTKLCKSNNFLKMR